MMEIALLITFLQQNVKRFEKEKKNKTHFLSELKYYVLGSILISKKPNDVDIIIVYNRENTPIYDLLEFRKVLRQQFLKKHSLPLDIILISSLEEKSLNYIEKEKARRIEL
ncbi:hypothetical protein ACQKNS_24530 [Peribacillus sp. NPDC094092]|uniref:hypothetical protein n=1 Tax=Peribacillus sp. NPDC094092 TaxID=3390611 RepID=UPI003D06A31B